MVGISSRAYISPQNKKGLLQNIITQKKNEPGEAVKGSFFVVK